MRYPRSQQSSRKEIVDKIHPETSKYSETELCARLATKIGKPVTIKSWTLRVDDKPTWISEASIENLWNAAMQFGFNKEEASNLIEKAVLKKLGHQEQNSWWRWVTG